MSASQKKDDGHESGVDFSIRVAKADVVRRRQVMSKLAGVDPAGPFDSMRPNWRTNSFAIHMNCLGLVNSYFLLAGWSLRRNLVGEALGYLAAAQQPIEAGHAMIRSGLYLDNGGGLEKSEWNPALLLPDGYCRLFLDRPMPDWISAYSGEEAIRQVDPQAKRSVGWGVVLHSLRCLWTGDVETACSLVAAADHVLRATYRRERGLLAWMQQVPNTALAAIGNADGKAAAALRAELDLFGRLDKPEPDAVDSWIASVGNGAHSEISVDWFAAACCRLRPMLIPVVRDCSPQLWTGGAS